MRWWGKFIGMFIGYCIARQSGALFGLLIGNFFDRGFMVQQRSAAYRAKKARTPPVDRFLMVTFMVMGCLAKADGRVAEAEVAAARGIMRQLCLNAAKQRLAIHYFTLGKQADFNLQGALTSLCLTYRQQPFVLKQFLDIQDQFVRAAAAYHIRQQQILETVRCRLGRRSTEYTRQRYKPATKETTLSDDYALLGLTGPASLDEVKSAYRRQMSACHPDKLMAQGKSQAAIAAATQKAQRIQAAYNRIKKSI